MSGTSYSIPTLSELIALAQNDVTTSELEGADGLLPISNLVIMAMVQARLAYDHYGYLERVARNSVPFTAENPFLDAWAALKGVYRKDATAAGLGPAPTPIANFTGTPGKVCPAGTQINRSDGFAYASVFDATVANSGTIAVEFAAIETGSTGNAPAGVQLTIANPVDGINSGGTAATVIVGGADQEDDDEFRTRMLAVYAAPPQGGDASDYVQWATAVAGVTRAWCSPNQMGAGTVVVYVMFDAAEAVDGGFPQGSNGVSTFETRPATTATGDQLTVADALFTLRPVTALVYVAAPIAQPIDFAFTALTPNTQQNQAAVRTALQALFLREGTALGSTFEQSDWTAALDAIPGLTSYAVSSPATSFQVQAGRLPTVGNLSFPAGS